MNPKDAITPHFTLGEFISPNDPWGWAHLIANQAVFMPRLRKLAGGLEKIRAHFGKPVKITSGLRSPRHNRRIGGALLSRHKAAEAADIWIDGVDPYEVAAFAKTLPEFGGVAVRPGAFTHLDIRPRNKDGSVTTWRY